MTVLRPLALALVTTALAAPAFALEFGNGFSLTGNVELEYVDISDADAESFGFADLTLGWRSQGGGAVGFGFDLTGVSYHFPEDGDSDSVLWGGLVMTTSFGELTVGRPRPLLETLSPAPDIGATRISDLELSALTGSYLARIGLEAGSLIDIFGASFEGSSGGFSYGMAIHRLSVPLASADVLQLTASYEVGATLIYAGLESFDEDIFDSQHLMLGARYQQDRWAVGIEGVRADLGPAYVNTYTLYGEYEVIEGLKIGAQILEISEDFAPRLFGLSGEYGFGSGGFADLGYLTSDDGDNYNLTASIGFRF